MENKQLLVKKAVKVATKTNSTLPILYIVWIFSLLTLLIQVLKTT